MRTTEVQVAADVSSLEQSALWVLQITQRLAKGDEEAFRRFHELYYDRLYRFLLVIARGQEHEAREALQETLVRVLRYAHPFETEEAFWCWLKVLARSAARDAGRNNRRYLALLNRFALRSNGSHWKGSEDEEDRLRELVEDTLDHLDPGDRLLIEGKYLQEQSVKELSAKTGLTNKAIESRLLRLRRHLRDGLLKKLRSL